MHIALAKRLARRGVTVAGASMAAALADSAAAAPAPLIASTIKAASLFAAGPAASAVLSGKVVALTEGVLKTMLLTKLKTSTVALLAVAAVATAAALTLPAPAAEQAQTAKTEKSAARDTDKPKAAPKPIRVKEANQLFRLAWAADGKTVATVGVRWEAVTLMGQKLLVGHSTIKLWDATTGKLKKSLGEQK